MTKELLILKASLMSSQMVNFTTVIIPLDINFASTTSIIPLEINFASTTSIIQLDINFASTTSTVSYR